MLAAAGLALQLLWLLTKKNKMKKKKTTQTRIGQILGPDLRRCHCVLAPHWPAQRVGPTAPQ